MKYFVFALALMALDLGLFACSPASTEGAATPAATAVVEATATSRPMATTQPTPTPEPTDTPTPEPLTVSDIFDQLSPSVARVMTGQRFGSGVLLDDGYVLTNAHVVWPEAAVTLIFPDGQEFEDVPVVGVDLLADLALLGPIETDLSPITFDDVNTLRVGSEILLIGYPGDASRAPRPTLTETLISRQREQEQLGLTLFQVDSPVAGGQSGGIALMPDGRVIGLTGNRITEAQFGLITSGADILPRIASMRQGVGLGNSSGRGPDMTKQNKRHFVRLRDSEEQRAFHATVDAGDELEVSADSNANAFIFVSNVTLSDFAFADDLTSGKESAAVEALESGTHYVVVGMDSPLGASIVVTSSVPLAPYDDPDDGQQLSQAETYEGVIDFPGDEDVFMFVMSRDQAINITVSGLMTNPFIAVRPLGGGPETIVSDDNSGDGIIGTEAELTYKSPSAGVYELLIHDASLVQTGGYVVTLQEPYEGAPTPVSPKPTPEPIASEFGEMTVFETPLFGFSIQHPASFTPQPNSPVCAPQYTACLADYSDPEFNFLTIIEVELGAPGTPKTLEEYATRLETTWPQMTNVSFISRDDIETAQGQPAVILEFESLAEELGVRTFITYRDDEAVFIAMYFYTAADGAELANYMFSTFEG